MGCCSSKPEPIPKPDQMINLEGDLYIALYDYTARSNADMSFQRDDIFEIINKTGDWWLARNQSGHTASIPRNFVEKYESIEAEPWYFKDITRPHAEKRLMGPENSPGAFLVRDSKTEKCQYSLSIRTDEGTIKHYRIRTKDAGGYFISDKSEFQTIKGLIEHYSHPHESFDRLCCVLGKPCVKVDTPIIIGLDPEDKWEIDRKEIKILTKLGSGSFGDVYKGVWKKTHNVAVKTLKPGTMEVADFVQEAQIMKKLRHENLVQLYAVCTKSEPIYIITELMVNGSLLNYLRSDIGKELILVQLIDIAEQIVRGMVFLEKNFYIHRDLAARNVLVGERHQIKIASFGLARVIKDDVYIDKVGAQFPIKWTAPEAINFRKFSIKSDVWSFGVLLSEIITYGSVPYPGLTNDEVIEKLEKGERMKKPRNCPQVLYDIMLECWHFNPQNRPTFEALQVRLEGVFSNTGDYY